MDFDQILLLVQQYGWKGAAVGLGWWLGKSYALPWLRDKKLAKYALKAIRLARNMANNSGLAMPWQQVEQMAIREFRKLAGRAAKKLGDEVIMDIIRDVYEAEREKRQRELNKWNADIAVIAARNDAARARLEAASKAADALNASRAPGGGGEP